MEAAWTPWLMAESHYIRLIVTSPLTLLPLSYKDPCDYVGPP